MNISADDSHPVLLSHQGRRDRLASIRAVNAATETSTAFLSLEPSLLKIVFKPGEVTLEKAKENVAAIQRVTAGKKMPALIEFTALDKTFPKESRDYITQP